MVAVMRTLAAAIAMLTREGSTPAAAAMPSCRLDLSLSEKSLTLPLASRVSTTASVAASVAGGGGGGGVEGDAEGDAEGDCSWEEGGGGEGEGGMEGGGMVNDASNGAEQQQQQHGSYDSRLPPYPVAGSRSNPGSSNGSAAEGSAAEGASLAAPGDMDMDTSGGGGEAVGEALVKPEPMAAEQMNH